MNEEQAKSAVRSVITAAGGIVIGWFASKGWHLSPDDTKNITALLQSPEFIGVLLSASGALWGHLTHTQTNAVAVVDAIAKQPDSPVKAVIMEATVEGVKAAQELPGNTTVVAGSTAAATAAQN
jgi:hypothetical protein